MAESKGPTVSSIEEHDPKSPDVPGGGAAVEPEASPAGEPTTPESAQTSRPGEVPESAQTSRPAEAPESAETSRSAETAEAAEQAEDAPAGYRMRRAPRYGAFGFTGVLIGVLLGAGLAMSFQATGDYSAQTILGYFVAIFGLFGALFGAGAAVWFDRRHD